MPDNPNYEVREDGAWRKESAPDATPKFRKNWLQRKLDSLENAQQGVSDLRRRQNERNREYRERHEDA